MCAEVQKGVRLTKDLTRTYKAAEGGKRSGNTRQHGALGQQGGGKKGQRIH